MKGKIIMKNTTPTSMNGPWHYRRASLIMQDIDDCLPRKNVDLDTAVAIAQAHATIAVASGLATAISTILRAAGFEAHKNGDDDE
ncbi:MAG: hypothetical protein ACREQ5_00635 [Candidatus Dormibacteria bacterium]